MGAGGPPHQQLSWLRERYPISVHGVGLSIGGAGRLDRDHLGRLKRLVDRYEPDLVSEHLAWSRHAGTFLNDLLPLRYDGEALATVVDHVDELQAALGRPVLLENPSRYLLIEGEAMPETGFLAEVSRRTGCGLLLDVNNVFVSATNLGFDPSAYIDRFPLDAVGELHLAGHAVLDDGDGPLLVDSHSGPVAEAVWTLFADVIERIGPKPSLIEWDRDVPSWSVLATEAALADGILGRAASRPARRRIRKEGDLEPAA